MLGKDEQTTQPRKAVNLMREILFRGKDLAGNWHYGTPLIFTENHVCIIAPHTYTKKVESDTVGQYTGLTDNNGKKIFEGDVVKVEGFLELAFVVIYYNGGFKLKEIGSEDLFAYYITESMVEEELIEVIGNIHDNLELQKGGEG